MGDLQDITANLSETQAAIVRLEEELHQMDVPAPSVESTLLILKRRQLLLEEQFNKAAANRNLEVCRYRLFDAETPDRTPNLKQFARAAIGLQNVFSLIYDALKANKPKQQARLSPDASYLTSFDLAYTFRSSLGFVLTLPAQAMVPLFGQTMIDEAMETVFKMLAANDPQDIAVYAKQVGLAPIRNLYEWVSDQAASGLSAEIQWRDRELKFKADVPYEDFEKLKGIIEASSEETIEEIELDGTLVGIDTTSRTFHMTFEDVSEMKGRIDEPIGQLEPVRVPRRYRARIRVTTYISYATEKETNHFLLLGLE